MSQRVFSVKLSGVDITPGSLPCSRAFLPFSDELYRLESVQDPEDAIAWCEGTLASTPGWAEAPHVAINWFVSCGGDARCAPAFDGDSRRLREHWEALLPAFAADDERVDIGGDEPLTEQPQPAPLSPAPPPPIPPKERPCADRPDRAPPDAGPPDRAQGQGNRCSSRGEVKNKPKPKKDGPEANKKAPVAPTKPKKDAAPVPPPPARRRKPGHHEANKEASEASEAEDQAAEKDARRVTGAPSTRPRGDQLLVGRGRPSPEPKAKAERKRAVPTRLSSPRRPGN
ncbi:hypothetical protein PAPYR_12779 [Paratrimastix pyriformis]|uniref:Uncharacterized protein n=1 Tax=Paratrimastix pyriformis TaxID=342808 RepID=A0ABQ8U1C0_9EUKA|nr:hypothetical protein PAPYR_12779 [Paratrimastix pyriformis]